MPEPRSEAVDMNVAVLPEAFPGKRALKDQKQFSCVMVLRSARARGEVRPEGGHQPCPGVLACDRRAGGPLVVDRLRRRLPSVSDTEIQHGVRETLNQVRRRLGPSPIWLCFAKFTLHGKTPQIIYLVDIIDKTSPSTKSGSHARGGSGVRQFLSFPHCRSRPVACRVSARHPRGKEVAGAPRRCGRSVVGRSGGSPSRRGSAI